MPAPAYSFTTPQTAPAHRASFQGFGRPPSCRTTVQVRRRSALGQSMMFGSDSSDEDEAHDEKESKSSETEDDSDHEVTTPTDENGPVQPLLVRSSSESDVYNSGEKGMKKKIVIEGNVGRRPTADELRKRLSRHATPSASAGGGVGVMTGQTAQQSVQIKPISRPPQVKPDPRKQLGLKAAIGSYQERRRVGHRRSQSSTSVEVPKLADDLRQSIVDAGIAAGAPASTSNAFTSPSQPITTTFATPISPSIQVTPASPEKPKWSPTPSLPPSPRRTASETFLARPSSDEISSFSTNGAPPSLDQIRKWAIRREKGSTVTLQPPPAPARKMSLEREKARSALDALTNAQAGGNRGIALRSSISSPDLRSSLSVPHQTTSIVPILRSTAPAPGSAVGMKTPTVVISSPTLNVEQRSVSGPSRQVKTAPVSPTRGDGIGANRAMQAQSMMARLSLRAASIAAQSRPKSPVLPLVSAV